MTSATERGRSLESRSAIKYDDLIAAATSDEARRYSDGDAMLYALSTGFGQEARELDYVFEAHGLKTVPSMAGSLFNFTFLDLCGWDAKRVTHSAQKLQLYRPLPPAADLRADRRVSAVVDHGRNAGASITIESEVRMAKDDTVLYTLGVTLLARGDGGFGGPTGGLPTVHKLPAREADLVCALSGRNDQALLFRLASDRNPLHADTQLARALGFERAPLQAQCIAGIACRAILKTICEYDFTLISELDMSFVAPVYPGEHITTEMWQDRNIVSFRCIATARNAVVVDHGRCALAA